MKINIGCGGKKLDGYINTDADKGVHPDVVCSGSNLQYFKDGSVDEVRMDAVYEHLYVTERPRAIREWLRVLKPGGNLVINWIPDSAVGLTLCAAQSKGPTDEFPIWDILMLERLTNGAAGLHNEQPYQLHKNLFWKERVRQELEHEGFVIDSLTNEMYPGERGEPYNICVVAHKP